MKRRKLGAKNNILFGVMSFLFIGIIVIFVYFINYQLKKKDNTYQLTSGVGLFDYKNNYIYVLDTELSVWTLHPTLG